MRQRLGQRTREDVDKQEKITTEESDMYYKMQKKNPRYSVC